MLAQLGSGFIFNPAMDAGIYAEKALPPVFVVFFHTYQDVFAIFAYESNMSLFPVHMLTNHDASPHNVVLNASQGTVVCTHVPKRAFQADLLLSVRRQSLPVLRQAA